MSETIVGKQYGRRPIEIDPVDHAAERPCAGGASERRQRVVFPHKLVDPYPPTRDFRLAPEVVA
ncbi:MAG TPA: hypothetical protein DIW77_11720 [Chromatiaceae bacterium]|jgi:hypothetical protein|nr:MAG: hypothetical protein N838_04310 [Thiohalocapsa sp. PB-PSB1]HCS90682.1 hypothetical protein [Chromatiaceae bacterium]